MYNYQKQYRYGFKNYEKESFSLNFKNNSVMSKYKSAIEGTVKVLQVAKNKPFDQRIDLREQINKLKQQLNEIESDVPIIDQEEAKKYPGSTGNGDSNYKEQINHYRHSVNRLSQSQ